MRGNLLTLVPNIRTVLNQLQRDLLETDRQSNAEKSVNALMDHNHNCSFDFGAVFGDLQLSSIQAERIFRIFGHQITAISMNRSNLDYYPNTPDDFLLSVMQFCQPNLSELSLANFVFGKDLMEQLKPLFYRIEVLELAGGSMHAPFGPMNNLRILRLHDIFGFWSYVNGMSLPKLEEVQFTKLPFIGDCFHRGRFNLLKRFLKYNRTIKKLTIVECGWEAVNADVLKSIGRLGDLEELELKQFWNPMEVVHFKSNMDNLASCHKLKVLKLNCAKCSVADLIEKFVKNGIVLEHLELADVPFDGPTRQNIIQLKTIKILKFNGMFHDSDALCFDRPNTYLSDLAGAMKLLSEFQIKSNDKITGFGIRDMVSEASKLICLKIDVPSFYLDRETYEQMLCILKNRVESNKLELTVFNGDAYGSKILVPDEAMYGLNEEWFQLKELRVGDAIFAEDVTLHPDINENSFHHADVCEDYCDECEEDENASDESNSDKDYNPENNSDGSSTEESYSDGNYSDENNSVESDSDENDCDISSDSDEKKGKDFNNKS